MSFEEFWTDTYKGGIPAVAMPSAMALAQAAWAAAVCSAQSACFSGAELRPAGEICDAISDLHTWNTSRKGGES